MKRIFCLLILVMLAIVSVTADESPKTIMPAPELLRYRAGTSDRLSQAIWSLRRADYPAAIARSHETIAHEPSCMEAYWILALAHQSRGELGAMLEALSAVGVRETREAVVALDIVNRGSKGYVLSIADQLLKLDYGLVDGTRPGDSFIIYAEGEALQHPITFQILYVEKRLVAEVEIRTVLSSHSTAELVKAYGRIEPGMRVVPKAEYDDVIELIATP